MDKKRENYNTNLRFLLRINKMSQDEISQMLGMKQSTFATYFTSKNGFAQDVRLQISKILNVSIEDMENRVLPEEMAMTISGETKAVPIYNKNIPKDHKDTKATESNPSIINDSIVEYKSRVSQASNKVDIGDIIAALNELERERLFLLETIDLLKKTISDKDIIIEYLKNR